MFFFLVTPSGAKTPYQTADLAELSATSVEHARELLEQLTKPRIVARLEHPERYEVYHDVLAPAVLRWRIDFEKEEDRAEAERKAEEERRRAEREAAAARRFRWLALALACSPCRGGSGGVVLPPATATGIRRRTGGIVASGERDGRPGARHTARGWRRTTRFSRRNPRWSVRYTRRYSIRACAPRSPGNSGGENALAPGIHREPDCHGGRRRNRAPVGFRRQTAADHPGGSRTADLRGDNAGRRSRSHGRRGWQCEGMGSRVSRAGDLHRAGERASGVPRRSRPTVASSLRAPGTRSHFATAGANC